MLKLVESRSLTQYQLDHGVDKLYVHTALYASLVANDLKHIHINATGNRFDDIHELAQRYYYKVSEEVDCLCELASEITDNNIPNLSLATSLVKYNPLTEIGYDYHLGMVAISKVLDGYIEKLKSLRAEIDAPDEHSQLDDFIRFWTKELSYKNDRRKLDLTIENTESATELND